VIRKEEWREFLWQEMVVVVVVVVVLLLLTIGIIVVDVVVSLLPFPTCLRGWSRLKVRW